MLMVCLRTGTLAVVTGKSCPLIYRHRCGTGTARSRKKHEHLTEWSRRQSGRLARV